jgi:sigma-B regulation protein RsbU (phosphoserine phosphatase)
MNSSPPQTVPIPPRPPRPGVLGHIQQFWHRVTEGLELSQLWKQFSTDARASYRLYQKDYLARAPQEKVKRGFWHTAQEFAWAILEKLTPARRVLLLLGVAIPRWGFQPSH